MKNIIVGKTQVAPEEVGYDSSRLEVLNKHFERLMDKNFIQSANYCLSRNGKVFANSAIGKLSYKENDLRDLQADSIHYIASISKIICATAIFKLFEDGYLRPLQPVSDVLPEFKKAPFDKINISHLLTHTSGLYPDGGCFPYEYKDYWDYVDQAKSNESWVATSLETGVFSEPGKQWAYCSFGFVLLGEIIRRTTGMYAETYIRKTIFEPCQMTSTGFFTELDRGELAEDFVKDFINKFYIQDEATEKIVLNLKNYKQWQKTKDLEDLKWSEIPGTASRVFSTAEDLNKFGCMLLNNGVAANGKRVLGRKAIERMTLNCTTDDIKNNCWGASGDYRMYALGPDTRWNEDSLFTKGSYFHEGSGACCLLVDPIEKMVASWFVPFAQEGWFAEALFNVSAVMWSGLK